MKFYQLAILMCTGCAGAAFTSVDALPHGDAGEVLEDAIAPLEDAGAVGRAPNEAGHEAAAVIVDAGGDERETVDAGAFADVEAPHDAGDADHRTSCNASDCPACPTLEKPCCNTLTLACGCYAPGITCH